jgi:hypothetical protein
VATLTADRYPSIDFAGIFCQIIQTNASMRKAYETAGYPVKLQKPIDGYT